MSVSKDELREVIREEIEPIEKMCQRTEDAVRGTMEKPGLNQRVASLEQSRSLAKKL